MIDGVPVFYSLGNFYFSQETQMPENYNTAMAQIVIQSDGTLSARLLPCYFSEGQLSLLQKGEQYDQILTEVESYSEAVTFDDDGYLVVH